jgi:hypothetical protein
MVFGIQWSFINPPLWRSTWRLGVIAGAIALSIVWGLAPPARGADGKSSASDSAKADSDGSSSDAKSDFRLEGVNGIVLWNEHNGKHHDNGARTCAVTLSLEGKTVWEKKNVDVPWEKNKSASCVVEVPGKKADKLRVEITAWNEKGGGLSEIEVLDKTGTNLALGGKVTTSDGRSPTDRLGGAALVDANYYSGNEAAGYWLLPEGEEGWAEIELVPQKIPPVAKEPPKQKKGKKTLSHVPLQAEVFVTCENAFELYVNGVLALKGHGQRCFSRRLPVANGDVFTAKCEGSSDTKGGFCFLVKFDNGHHLSTINGWKVYTPSSPADWFNPERAKGSVDPTKGTSGWAEKEMKQDTKGKIPQIWGTGKTVYLVMKADTTVLHPKMKPGKGPKR